MKLVNDIRPRDDGADIYLSTDDGRNWAFLRWNSGEGSLAGVTGIVPATGLANVRAYRLEAEITAENVGGYCVYALLSGTKIRAIDSSADRSQSRAGILDAWESFLEGRAPSGKGPEREDPDRNAVELEGSQVRFMVGEGLVQVSNGEVALLRFQGARLGEAMSGFDAARFQTALHKALGVVPAIPAIDMAAAKNALAAVARPSSSAVLWYGTATGQQAQDRAQVARAYPPLAGMIADNPVIARAVDAREPIQPVLTEWTALGKAGLKRLSKITAPPPAGKLFEDGEAVHGQDALGVDRQRRFAVSGHVPLGTALKHLAELPADRVPQDDASWQIFHDILGGCAIPIENALGIPVARTLAAMKGDWKAFHAALAKSADFKPEKFDRRAIALAMIDAIEALDDFSRSAVLPLILSSIQDEGQQVPAPEQEFIASAFQTATSFVLGDSKNIASSLFEMARRYASRVPTLMDALSFEVDENVPVGKFSHYQANEFPVLTRKFSASNGLVVTPFTNFAMMKEESRRLKHCVGRAYLTNARTASSHLYSIRTADGSKSISTLELSGIQRGANEMQTRRAFRSVQHRAYRNDDPPLEAKLAVREFISAIHEGRIPIERDLLLEWKEQAAFNMEGASFTWKGALGMEWEDQSRRQAAWEEWRYIIGGPAGKAEHPGIIWKEKSARDLLGEMNPGVAAKLAERARQARQAPREEPAPAL